MDSSTVGASGAIPLATSTLGRLDGRVSVPTYDRTALAPTVVHMSVGCFHRSHQAVYFDDLARLGEQGWGVVGVGLHRRNMRDALAPQDGLYTVVERGEDHESARVVGVLQRYLFAPDDPAAVLAALVHERTRLLTLTVTGAAYHIDPATGAFDAGAPDVQADLANPGAPASFLGFVVEALDRRRRAGLPPFTVLSCDNLMDNGRIARSAVVSYARLRDTGLADWIEHEAAFPSSMVDRITPRTTSRDRARLARDFGVDDFWPVIAEPFRQWVVEDDFCNGRPPLERVGVQFVPDARPYSITKTRLLNAAHVALGHLGTLAGFERTDEAMRDPALRAFVTRMMADEVAPLLPDAPGIDLDAYQQVLLDRLSNPKIGDQLERLGRCGSTKVPTHLLSSIRGAVAEGRRHDLLTLAVAGWIRVLQGDEPVDDPRAEVLQALARAGGTDPRPILGESAVFGDMGDDPRFVAALEQALEALTDEGARAAIDAILGADAPLVA